jgi:hypothetical protein
MTMHMKSQEVSRQDCVDFSWLLCHVICLRQKNKSLVLNFSGNSACFKFLRHKQACAASADATAAAVSDAATAAASRCSSSAQSASSRRNSSSTRSARARSSASQARASAVRPLPQCAKGPQRMLLWQWL